MFFIKDRPICYDFKRPFATSGVIVYKYKPDRLYNATKLVYLLKGKTCFTEMYYSTCNHVLLPTQQCKYSSECALSDLFEPLDCMSNSVF